MDLDETWQNNVSGKSKPIQFLRDWFRGPGETSFLNFSNIFLSRIPCIILVTAVVQISTKLGKNTNLGSLELFHSSILNFFSLRGRFSPKQIFGPRPPGIPGNLPPQKFPVGIPGNY